MNYENSTNSLLGPVGIAFLAAAALAIGLCGPAFSQEMAYTTPTSILSSEPLGTGQGFMPGKTWDIREKPALEVSAETSLTQMGCAQYRQGHWNHEGCAALFQQAKHPVASAASTVVEGQAPQRTLIPASASMGDVTLLLPKAAEPVRVASADPTGLPLQPSVVAEKAPVAQAATPVAAATPDWAQVIKRPRTHPVDNYRAPLVSPVAWEAYVGPNFGSGDTGATLGGGMILTLPETGWRGSSLIALGNLEAQFKPHAARANALVMPGLSFPVAEKIALYGGGGLELSAGTGGFGWGPVAQVGLVFATSDTSAITAGARFGTQRFADKWNPDTLFKVGYAHALTNTD